MILHFPYRQEKIEKKSAGRVRFPEGEWAVLPSRQTFLVPLTLPARLMRRLDDAQLHALAFDRIPLEANSTRIWMIRPRLGFFSRGAATALAVIAPLKVLPADAARCLPEDVLLASVAFEKRFAKGGLIVLDAPECVSVIGVSPGARILNVQKHFSDGGPVPGEQIQSLVGELRRGAVLLRLNAGGSGESIFARYGNPVTEEATTFLSDRLPAVLGEKRMSLRPKLLESAQEKSARAVSARALPQSPPRLRLRYAAVLLSLLLPAAALSVMKERMDRMSSFLTKQMSESYEKRFGAKVPDPLLALRAKSESISKEGRLPAVPLSAWLALADRLSSRAAESALRLDVISLDGVRVEIRGTSADLQSVAQWVSGLTSDPALQEPALVSSENRMSDRRAAFLVRAKFKIEGESE